MAQHVTTGAGEVNERVGRRSDRGRSHSTGDRLVFVTPPDRIKLDTTLDKCEFSFPKWMMGQGFVIKTPDKKYSVGFAQDQPLRRRESFCAPRASKRSGPRPRCRASSASSRRPRSPKGWKEVLTAGGSSLTRSSSTTSNVNGSPRSTIVPFTGAAARPSLGTRASRRAHAARRARRRRRVAIRSKPRARTRSSAASESRAAIPRRRCDSLTKTSCTSGGSACQSRWRCPTGAPSSQATSYSPPGCSSRSSGRWRSTSSTSSGVMVRISITGRPPSGSAAGAPRLCRACH